MTGAVYEGALLSETGRKLYDKTLLSFGLPEERIAGSVLDSADHGGVLLLNAAGDGSAPPVLTLAGRITRYALEHVIVRSGHRLEFAAPHGQSIEVLIGRLDVAADAVLHCRDASLHFTCCNLGTSISAPSVEGEPQKLNMSFSSPNGRDGQDGEAGKAGRDAMTGSSAMRGWAGGGGGDGEAAAKFPISTIRCGEITGTMFFTFVGANGGNGGNGGVGGRGGNGNSQYKEGAGGGNGGNGGYGGNGGSGGPFPIFYQRWVDGPRLAVTFDCCKGGMPGTPAEGGDGGNGTPPGQNGKPGSPGKSGANATLPSLSITQGVS